MVYAYDSKIRLGEVVLNVHDLEKQVAFYSDGIGFKVLKQTGEAAYLGLAGSDEVLMRLVKTALPAEDNYGLYHTAILVPDRLSLGAALKHLVTNGLPLTGGADHGYSEAIYLNDPEGNGIEIYRDKPMAEWDIREDGRIIGVTEELDADGVLAEAPDCDSFTLSEGTVIGHVHLSVKNAIASSKLYQRVFDLGDKMTILSASWIASGNYHHQLAFNQWAGSHLAKRRKGLPGLNYLTVYLADELFFKAVLKKAVLYGLTVLESSEREFWLEDSDGIQTRVILENL
ncbi:VOC family protein [Streptococcus dentiloxodontae]